MSKEHDINVESHHKTLKDIVYIEIVPYLRKLSKVTRDIIILELSELSELFSKHYGTPYHVTFDLCLI